MEDFFYAGGVPAVMRELGDLLDRDALTVTGKTIGENVATATVPQPRRDPHASPSRFGRGRHRRPARQPRARAARSSSRPPPREHLLTPHAAARSSSRPHRAARRASTTPTSTSTPTPCWCSRTPARRARPGMPEWGQLPIPSKLLRAGRDRHGADLGRAHERHLLRHRRAARRAGVGRRRAARSRPHRRRDRAGRRRRAGSTCSSPPTRSPAAWPSGGRPSRIYSRGYGRLFLDHVLQADEGCDFDFLVGDGAPADDLGARYARIGHS